MGKRIGLVIIGLLVALEASAQQQCSMACDVNADGVASVSVQDYAAFNASFGKKIGDAGYNARADLDGNGSVGISDYGLMLKFCPLSNK